VKIVAWNVRQGGGPRASRIVDAIVRLRPDVVLITEYRETGRARLRELLDAHGYAATHCTPDPRGGYEALLLAASTPVELGEVTYNAADDGHRFLHVTLPRFGWEIGAAYVPNAAPRSTAKQEMWSFLTDTAAPALRHRRAVLIGDFNTGLHYRDETGKTFVCADDMQRLLDSGWRDAWACTHPRELRPPSSWWSNAGNGFRLDHCFMSPAAPEPTSVEYAAELDGSLLGGRGGLSDHSPLIIDLNTPG